MTISYDSAPRKGVDPMAMGIGKAIVAEKKQKRGVRLFESSSWTTMV